MNPETLKLTQHPYVKIAIWVIGGIIVLWVLVTIFRFFSRVTASAKATAGIAADKAENAAVAQQTGIAASHIEELRDAAYTVADELETRTGRGWWEDVWHRTNNTKVINALNVAASSNEMSVLKNFYAKLFTDNRNLYTDVTAALTGDEMKKVTFHAAMR